MNKIEDFMHKFSFYFTEQAAGPFLRYGILPGKEHRRPFVSGLLVDFMPGCGVYWYG